MQLVQVGRPWWQAALVDGFLAPLAYPRFRLAWAARVVSLMGDNFQIVALAALALGLTHRTSVWASVLVIEALPRTVLLLAGGVATDRLRPQTVIVRAQLVQGTLTALLATLAATGHLSLWHLYLYAPAMGTAGAFALPASMAMVPDTLPPEQVRRGNALWSLAINMAQLIAPPLAGVVVALGGGATAVAANAASFFIAALLLRMAGAGLAARAPSGSALRQLVEGLRAARRDPVVWRCILTAPIYTLGSTGAIGVGLPALAKLVLDAGDQGVGLLYGSVGAGAVIGALSAGMLARLPRHGIVTVVACVGVGIALALGGAAPALHAALLPLAIAGALQACAVVLVFSIVQTRTPAAVRGRVMALYTLGIFGPGPVSYSLAGVVGDAFGPRWIFVLGGALVALAGLLLGAGRAVRELE